jgi:hypothetical protein
MRAWLEVADSELHAWKMAAGLVTEEEIDSR